MCLNYLYLDITDFPYTSLEIINSIITWFTLTVLACPHYGRYLFQIRPVNNKISSFKQTLNYITLVDKGHWFVIYSPNSNLFGR